MLFVVGVYYSHRFTLTQFRKQGLGVQLRVGFDHIVGGAQNGAGGAVVLLQLDHLQLWKVLWQTFQVVERRAAPAINGLIVVTHGCEPGALAYQVFQYLVLRGIGVLVFVHQHVAHGRLPTLAHFGMVGK